MLIAGLGFAGVIYTIRLQIQENQRHRVELSKGYLLNSLAAALQAYTAIYMGDKEFYDEDFGNAPTDPEEAESRGLLLKQFTVRGKMESYSDSIEEIISEIRSKGDFTLPS